VPTKCRRTGATSLVYSLDFGINARSRAEKGMPEKPGNELNDAPIARRGRLRKGTM